MCRFRSFFSLLLSAVFLSRSLKSLFAVFLVLFSVNSFAGRQFYGASFYGDCSATDEEACAATVGKFFNSTHKNVSSAQYLGWSQCRVTMDYRGYSETIPSRSCNYVPVCDITTAQNFVDAANAESGPPVTYGPYAKPAAGTGLHINVGYQVDNYCQFGCQMTHLVTQDVTEDDYAYQVTESEALYVQDSPCDASHPPPADNSSVTPYYIPPTAERTLPPLRDPSAPPNYPPNAPPPPAEPPAPPPDAPPPPDDPDPCINCDPVTPESPPEGPPPDIPPFIPVDPPTCTGDSCYPPPPVTPPADPVPPENGGSPLPSGGCPAGTSWGSKNGVNGCYGAPKGQCSEGQYWGEVDGKEGCYGAKTCKEGEVYGSIGDAPAQCYELESCYVQGNCNKECDPETETCESNKGEFSKDCKVTPNCGDADAVECAILRQSWVTSCNAVQKASSITDCNQNFVCENDPVQCALAAMHRKNLCETNANQVYTDISNELENLGLSKVDDFTDDDIFEERDFAALTGNFLDGDTRAGSCPPDIQLNLFGNTITVSLSLLCIFGGYVRAFLLVSASIIGLRMFFNAFVNN